MVLKFFGTDSEEPKRNLAPSGSSLHDHTTIAYVCICSLQRSLLALRSTVCTVMQADCWPLPCLGTPRLPYRLKTQTCPSLVVTSPSLVLSERCKSHAVHEYSLREFYISTFFEDPNFIYPHFLRTAWCWSKQGLTSLEINANEINGQSSLRFGKTQNFLPKLEV